MMTSTQGLRKGKEKNAEPDPGTVLLSKLSMAASEARNATMASIAELVDDAAAKNGGRVPKGFIPKVIQQFSIVAPGLNRDKINYYRKGSALVVITPESLMASSLPPDENTGPPRKRQKGGRPKGTTVKSSQAEYDIYQKVCAEAARRSLEQHHKYRNNRKTTWKNFRSQQHRRRRRYFRSQQHRLRRRYLCRMISTQLMEMLVINTTSC
jgi:hypothetical protein